MLVNCGRCSEEIDNESAEYCWYCMAYLCGDCWEEIGHCGHEEADRINEEARNESGR